MKFFKLLIKINLITFKKLNKVNDGKKKTSNKLVKYNLFEIFIPAPTTILDISYKNYLNNFIKCGNKNTNLQMLKKFSINILRLFLLQEDVIKTKYTNCTWFLNYLLFKKINFFYIFNILVNLIKSPFIIKTSKTRKIKASKQLKHKYVVEVVHKSDIFKKLFGIKQFYYFNSNYLDSKFSSRMFKTIVFTLLEGKNSPFYKNKLYVFKKFLK